MSAIKEFVINFTKEYQALSEPSDQRAYPAFGAGDRARSGPELTGLISACRLDKINGIDEWFAHLAQDLTSPAGIPLPFAAAVQNITGIQTDEAVEWLTVNGADLIDTGTEAELLSFLKDNPKAYQYALVLGTVWGFSDDDPLLIAMNALFYLGKLKKEGRLQRRFWGGASRFA